MVGERQRTSDSFDPDTIFMDVLLFIYHQTMPFVFFSASSMNIFLPQVTTARRTTTNASPTLAWTTAPASTWRTATCAPACPATAASTASWTWPSATPPRRFGATTGDSASRGPGSSFIAGVCQVRLNRYFCGNLHLTDGYFSGFSNEQQAASWMSSLQLVRVSSVTKKGRV